MTVGRDDTEVHRVRADRGVRGELHGGDIRLGGEGVRLFVSWAVSGLDDDGATLLLHVLAEDELHLRGRLGELGPRCRSRLEQLAVCEGRDRGHDSYRCCQRGRQPECECARRTTGERRGDHP